MCTDGHHKRFSLQFFKGLSLAILLTSLVFYWFMRVTNPAAAGSTVASLYDLVESTMWFEATTDQWQDISEADYLLFVQHYSSKIDSGPRGWQKGGILVDPWGNVFRVAMRKGSDDHAEYVVWTNGGDGMKGTDDDVYVHTTSGGVQFMALSMPADGRKGEREAAH